MTEIHCPKCDPRQVILPLDEGNAFDINESELASIAGQNPVNGASGGTAAPPISFNAGMHAVGGEPADFKICGPTDGRSTSLSLDGAKIFTAYDELPEEAAQGQMACIKGEDITYVYDGEEWQNLGEALLGKKRNVVPPQDVKCDRRGAIAATKAKNA